MNILMAESKPSHLTGLSQAAAEQLLMQHGKNNIRVKKRTFLKTLLGVTAEPMFILLLIATSAYFIAGEPEEGLLTAAAIIIVTAVSIYQDIRSSHAMEALREYTQEKVAVIRDGAEKLILTEDLVPGDIVVLVEGNLVPADAHLLEQNDFTVNEAVITGESFPVEKKAGEDQVIYQGTTVNSGKCYATVTETGGQTQLGKLGKAAAVLSAPKTLLQKQLGRYVKQLAIFGLTALALIWIINYSRSGDVVQSLLFGLVLAMAAIPEELPVAFSAFMALGAYQLSKLGIITRNPQVIENLGTVTVICLDKTGTITENRMTVKKVYIFEDGQLVPATSLEKQRDVLRYAALASERSPFDAMEKAILGAYSAIAGDQLADAVMIHEYPLEGKPPMMTHVYQTGHTATVAGKGAMERILNVCRVSQDTLPGIHFIARTEASKGYRVIGVAGATWKTAPWPKSQDDFEWRLIGLVCLYDPPRDNMPEVIGNFYEAGIAVKLLTGDYLETAVNISGQAGIKSGSEYLTGEQVLTMTDEQLRTATEKVSVFARMFPEAKQRVIQTLQAGRQVVAMIGDGVNDVPALKMADIGIAMGKKGAEMARQAADLIFTDDKLEKLTEAIRQGRKIFQNLKKSIRYIITIHIPIILTATLPVIFGWRVVNIFTPVHIIFLELIMGPTCSLFFEREPVEADIMRKAPRGRREGILNRHELGIGITQGVVVTAAILGLYFFRMKQQAAVEQIRTEVLVTLLFANIFLTLVNRSFSAHIFQTIRYRNNLAPWVLASSFAFIATILLIPAVRTIFGLATLETNALFTCIGLALASAGWYEVYKYLSQRSKKGCL